MSSLKLSEESQRKEKGKEKSGTRQRVPRGRCHFDIREMFSAKRQTLGCFHSFYFLHREKGKKKI